MNSDEELQMYRGEQEVATLNAKIRAAEKPAPVHVETEAELQARADKMAFEIVRDRAKPVFAEYGRQVPLRNAGEDMLSYRKRIVRTLQPESNSYADRDVRSVPAELFSEIEQKVYREAVKNRWHPSDLKPNQMREVVKIDGEGRKVSEFVTGRGSKAMFKQVYGSFIAPGIESPIHNIDAKGNATLASPWKKA